MADNIVDSLFGLQPWQIQQQQNAALGQSADKYAAQDPFQRATGSMYRAGGMMAGPVAESMGYVNPAIEQAKMREQVMGQGGDLLTSAGLKAKAAQFAQAGDQQTAMKLIMAARKQEAEEADLKLKQAHAKYYEQGGAKTGAGSKAIRMQAVLRSATEAAMNMLPEQRDAFIMQELQRASDQWDRDAGAAQPQMPQPTAMPPNVGGISASNETPTQLSPVSQVAAPEGALPPEALAAIRADMASRGDAQGAAALPGQQRIFAPTKAQSAGEKKLAETIAANNPAALAGGAAAKEGGKTGVEIYTKQFHSAEAASRIIPKVDALITQLKTGDVTTGVGADLRIGISRLQSLLGGKEAAKNATDSQIADVMMGSEVFPLIQSLGIGARGMDTPAERDFMRKVLTGELSLEKGTLIRMAELRKEAAQKDIDRWDSQVDRGDLDQYFSNVGIPKTKFGQQKKPSEMSALPPPSQLTGKTVRDTVTGKRYKSNGTQWVGVP